MIADGALVHAAFLGLYLFALIGVGAMKARSIKNQEDFSLAGRGLPTVVLVGTLLATWIGTGSIFGNAEEAYGAGVAVFLLPLSSGLGIIALVMLAPRIRRFEQFTIQDILEARFGPVARVLGTLTLLAAYVIIVSYQYRAGASVVERMFPDLGRDAAICLVAFFVVAYTALAGLISVAYTDVANGVLMAVGLALALPFLLDEAGGVEGVTAALGSERGSLLGTYSATHLLSIMLPAFLLLLGDANMVQRFFAARSPGSARRAAAWMFGGVLLLDWAIVAVALCGRALVEQGVVPAPANDGHVVVHLAFEILPTAVGALLVGTVVAVVVSTADSYLLSPATSIVRDVIQRFLVPDLGDRGMVRAARAVVVALGLIALVLAFQSDEFFEVALFAYTIYGAGITPALLAAYFWKRATAAGAAASMLTGVGVALAWKAVTTPDVRARLDAAGVGFAEPLGRWAAESEIHAVLPAVAVSVVVLVAVSLATPPPDRVRADAF